MIFQILQSDLGFMDKTIMLVYMPVVILLSLTIHEVSHGLASYIQGDPTAKLMGRITLNPLKHLDPLGTLCMVICGFGWARPVPIDPRFYKNKKKGTALTALAGPITNLVIGIWFLTFYCVMFWLVETEMIQIMPILKHIPAYMYRLIYNLMYIAFYYNLLLAVFNLFPVPPLDGSRIMLAVLPTKTYFRIMRYERVIMLVLFLMLWTGAFTGIFEVVVDTIIRGVSTLVFAVLEAFFNTIM